MPLLAVMKIGRERLAAYLRRSRLKQNELADMVGVSAPYLSQIVRGRRKPGLDMALRIEQVTGVPVDSWAATLRGNKDIGKQAAAKRTRLQQVLTDASHS